MRFILLLFAALFVAQMGYGQTVNPSGSSGGSGVSTNGLLASSAVLWKLSSVTTNVTGASQLSLTLPVASGVRYTMLLQTNGYFSGLGLAATINGNTNTIYVSNVAKVQASGNANYSATNAYWLLTTGGVTFSDRHSKIELTIFPGNKATALGGVIIKSTIFGGDARSGYSSTHNLDGSAYGYNAVTNMNIFWATGATNHWFMPNTVVYIETIE